MYERIETTTGAVVIVRAEPNNSISLLAGRSGVYVLASCTREEARSVRAMLLEALRALALVEVMHTLEEPIAPSRTLAPGA